MFNLISTAIQNAIDVVAPPALPIQDLKLHYDRICLACGVDPIHNCEPLSERSVAKTIEETNIEYHLHEILKLLENEAKNDEDGRPCLDYCVNNNILGSFSCLANENKPTGVRSSVLTFFRALLFLLPPALLHHKNVRPALSRLVKLVCRSVGKSQNEETSFLLALCNKLKSHPELSTLFLETAAEGESQEQWEVVLNLKFPLVEALLILLQNNDQNTFNQASLALLACLKSLNDCTARVVGQTNLYEMLTAQLTDRLINLPHHLLSYALESTDARFGNVKIKSANAMSVPEEQEIASYLAWLDFCDKAVGLSHPLVADSFLAKVRTNILEAYFQPLLVQEDSINKTMEITAHIARWLQHLNSERFLQEISHWLVGDVKLRDLLIERCNHICEDLTLETLRLFEVLLDGRNRHALEVLVLDYVSCRGYYDPVAAGVAVDSWSDEEDEREKKNTAKIGQNATFVHSRTLAPTRIDKIIQKYLLLLPDGLRENGYENCIRDAELRYKDTISNAILHKWPLEATVPAQLDTLETNSADSRPESDKELVFTPGPFLSMLFSKTENLFHQPYEVSLRVTSLVSKLALLPHAYLHEYLLNPLTPVHLTTPTLFKSLQICRNQLWAILDNETDFLQLVNWQRGLLLGENTKDLSLTLTTFDPEVTGAIVFQEFCKELAAIAYVKFSHCLPQNV